MTASDTLCRFEPVSMKLQASNPTEFARVLGVSFREYGFAAISDHGLDQGLIDRATAMAAKFFALPIGEKRAYFHDDLNGARGYTPFGTEIAKGASHVDLKEFWHVGRDLSDGHPYAKYMAANLVPSEIEGWKETVHGLYTAFDALGARILSAIAIDLGLEKDFFVDTVRDGNSVMRLLHYPPTEGNTSQSIRAEAHEDINTITLLLGAEERGLQVKTRNGEWVDMNPPKGCLAVNMGDMLARSTNDVLPSTTHRVINPEGARRGKSRYSMPFFLHSRPDYMIKTLPGCASADNPDKYLDPISSHDYLMERLCEIGLVK